MGPKRAASRSAHRDHLSPGDGPAGVTVDGGGLPEAPLFCAASQQSGYPAQVRWRSASHPP
jgi:hypothetical protein